MNNGKEERRKLPYISKEDIQQAVKEAFVDPSIVSPETHEKHHRWLDNQIKRQEDCARNRQRMLVHLLGWLAVSFVSGICFLLWHGFREAIK